MEAPAPAPRGRSAPDDASCASKSQASIDLSELFNPSALTRLLRQLNDQIDGQRDQIVLLEEQSIANAAFREMWAQDRAEFRAALAVATEENNKKINEAIGAAATSVSDLRKTYNDHRVGDNTAAFLEQRALHDAEQARRASSKQARAQAKLDAGALDPANAPAYQRGFRATKRLPGKAQRPQSAPRSGRALP